MTKQSPVPLGEGCSVELTQTREPLRLLRSTLVCDRLDVQSVYTADNIEPIWGFKHEVPNVGQIQNVNIKDGAVSDSSTNVSVG